MVGSRSIDSRVARFNNAVHQRGDVAGYHDPDLRTYIASRSRVPAPLSARPGPALILLGGRKRRRLFSSDP